MNAHEKEAQRHESGAERFIALLHCARCRGERPHTVHYRDTAVGKMVCTDCRRELRIPPRHGRPAAAPERRRRAPRRRPSPGAVVWTVGSAAFGLSARALTKPPRLLREVLRRGPGAVADMPRRVVSKPFRLARELEKKLRRSS